MEREIVQKIFNRDFRQLLGVDIFDMAQDLEYLCIKEWWQELLTEPVVNFGRIMYINLNFIINDFLTYDPERFPNPLDQYIYIYENREKIVSMLGVNLEVESPFDDPIAYKPHLELVTRFDVLFTGLLSCGKTHKFDPEIVGNILDTDPDEED